MLTNEKMKEYLQIAVLIDSGAIPVPLLLEDFQQNQERAAEMVNFWLTFDEFTQKVANYIAIEKCKIYLENCYRKDFKCSTMKQNLLNIANGLKQILFGVKGCLIGALKTLIKD